jgi:hypothetical protein
MRRDDDMPPPGALVVVVIMLIGFATMMAGANAQQPSPSPCVRSGQPPAGGVDLDQVRCRIALDTQRMGQMLGELNDATAAITLAREDARKAAMEKAAMEQRVRDWEGYAKPLYAPSGGAEKP